MRVFCHTSLVELINLTNIEGDLSHLDVHFLLSLVKYY